MNYVKISVHRFPCVVYILIFCEMLDEFIEQDVLISKHCERACYCCLSKMTSLIIGVKI